MISGVDKNRIGQLLGQGARVIGARSGMGSPFLVDLVVRLNFDCIVVDGWSPELSTARVEELLRAAHSADLPAIVRLREARTGTIQQALDQGACGVQIAARTREEVELVLESIRYPPRGQRPASEFARGRSSQAWDQFRLVEPCEQALFILEVGTFESVENLDDLLAVGGVDAVHIDLLNLSLGLGYERADDPQVQEVMRFIVKSCARAGVPAGRTWAPLAPDEGPPLWCDYLLLPIEPVMERAVQSARMSAQIKEEEQPC